MVTYGDDAAFLKKAAPEIEPYLLSQQLSWPLDSGNRLTLAGILLALKRLETVPVSVDAVKLQQQIDAVKQRWQTNWTNKAMREYGARLRQWDHALQEILSGDRKVAAHYAVEVQWRVMLELLKDEARGLPETEQQQLELLDRRLRAASKPGAFVWEQSLKDAFPADQFWYLYLHLPVGGK